MDDSSAMNTSLDLNLNPSSGVTDEIPKNEVEDKFFALELKSSPSTQERSGDLEEELNRVSAENKKLTEMLTEVCENYNTLWNHLSETMRKNNNNNSNSNSSEKEMSPPKKRKSDQSSNNNNSNPIGVYGNNNNNSDSSSTDEEESSKKPRQEIIKAKISKVYVRTPASDTTLIVKDGYQWRKYGQKVTRDNPCPRAYFKCSFAPSCPVKKKVQRSVDDQSILAATYEGEHNHDPPSQMEAAASGSSRSIIPSSSSSLRHSPPKVTVDMKKSKSFNESTNSIPKLDSSEVPQVLVEQMATSLTNDPNFRSALLAAISGRILHKK